MYEKINEDLKVAMKEKDTFKLSVLRMLKSALQLEQISKKHELDDNEVSAVLKKQVKISAVLKKHAKIRKDSLTEYEKYGKVDSVKQLEEEIKILSNYLPEELDATAVEALVDEAINEVNPSSMKEMGLVMKKINELLVGKNADMSLVSKLVKEKIIQK